MNFVWKYTDTLAVVNNILQKVQEFTVLYSILQLLRECPGIKQSQKNCCQYLLNFVRFSKEQFQFHQSPPFLTSVWKYDYGIFKLEFKFENSNYWYRSYFLLSSYMVIFLLHSQLLHWYLLQTRKLKGAKAPIIPFKN